MLVTRLVVAEQNRGAPLSEELLEREDLPPIAEWVFGQQPQLGKRIEHHQRGLQALRLRDDLFGGLGQLHLGRVIHRVTPVGLDAVLRGRDFEDLDGVQRPAVGPGGRAELFLGLRQAHEQALLAASGAGEEELQRQRGLARTGISLDQEETILDEPAGQHVIQALDSGRDAAGGQAGRSLIDHVSLRSSPARERC